ncbi:MULTISPECIES: hypothetical protein [Bacteroidales]|uniref:hypothetical protein n=1 Tax=Bacteroidales TaxID=171549 RepID=UPI0025740DFD|nr:MULTISPECIES: hypothetical protein [Bacteroidales]MCR9010828.1 hypothetical protein [Gabonibacter chumensis]
MKQKKEYEWHGLERFHVIHEIDLFRHLDMDRLKRLFPDIFGKPKTKLVKKKQRN